MSTHHLVLRPRYVVHHNALGPHYFHVAVLVLIVGAIRPVHYRFPVATGAHLHFGYGIGKAIRPPPVLDMFRVGPYFKYQLAGRIEYAGDAHGALCPLVIVLICLCHFFSF